MKPTSGLNVEMGLELGRRESVRVAGQSVSPVAQRAIELRGRLRW